MINSRRFWCADGRFAAVLVAVVVSVLLPAGKAYPQTGGDGDAAPAGAVNLRNSGPLFGFAGRDELPGGLRTEPGPGREPTRAPLSDFRHSLATVGACAARVSRGESMGVPQSSSGSRQRFGSHPVKGGVVGAVLGLFAGGAVGVKMEGHSCHCDDPGILGLTIGAPLGAVIGGILGAKFL